MPGLVPGIHVFASQQQEKTWMAGTSPAMTRDTVFQPFRMAALVWHIHLMPVSLAKRE
jgi:hypothetical protein